MVGDSHSHSVSDAPVSTFVTAASPAVQHEGAREKGPSQGAEAEEEAAPKERAHSEAPEEALKKVRRRPP